MTVTTLLPTDTEAQLDEGLAPLPPEQAAQRAAWLALDQQKKEILAAMGDLRDSLGAALVADGLQGFTEKGRVVVRYSEVNTARLDTKLIKQDLPEVFAKYSKVTKSERVNIT